MAPYRVLHGDWEDFVIHGLSNRFSRFSKIKRKLSGKQLPGLLAISVMNGPLTGLTQILTDADGDVRDAAQKALDSIQNEKTQKEHRYSL